MAPSKVAKLQDSLTCSVCMEQYNTDTRKPTLLPCQHTFCLCCLKAMPLNISGMSCPDCGGSAQPSMINTNHAMLAVVEVLQNDPPVQHDTNDTVILTCITHRNGECVLVCIDCLDGLCLKCVTTGCHRGHKLEELSDAVAMLRPRFYKLISNELSDLEKNLSLISDSAYSVAEINMAEADLNEIVGKVETVLHKWTEQQLLIIENLKQEALKRENDIQIQRRKLQFCLANEDIDIVTLIEKLRAPQQYTHKQINILKEPVNFTENCKALVVDIASIFSMLEDCSKLLKPLDVKFKSNVITQTQIEAQSQQNKLQVQHAATQDTTVQTDDLGEVVISTESGLHSQRSDIKFQLQQSADVRPKTGIPSASVQRVNLAKESINADQMQAKLENPRNGCGKLESKLPDDKLADVHLNTMPKNRAKARRLSSCTGASPEAEYNVPIQKVVHLDDTLVCLIGNNFIIYDIKADACEICNVMAKTTKRMLNRYIDVKSDAAFQKYIEKVKKFYVAQYYARE